MAWWSKLEAAYDRATVRRGRHPNWQFHPGGLSVATVQRSVCPHCEMSTDLCIEFGCPAVESSEP